MPSERRNGERHAKRLEVRFWRSGRLVAHSGFTTNVSTSGMFLGTTQSLDPGERVRLEVLDSAHGFVVEGQVARVHRVSLSLRHVDQPGAGVRFLGPPELVAGLIPAARQTAQAARAQRSERGNPAPPATPPPGAGAPSAPAGGVSSGAPAGPPPGSSAAAGRPEAAGAEPPSPAPPGPPESPTSAKPALVVVEFTDRTGFLSVYHRDLAAGSMHVSTDIPAQLHDTVVIEIHPPLDNARPLRFEATVIHRFEPRAAVGPGANVLSGMGVRFKEPELVKAALAPVLAELRK
jgi:Tfp pilus assembly protein PilZ